MGVAAIHARLIGASKPMRSNALEIRQRFSVGTGGAVLLDAAEMPDGMSVHQIEEILGESCCDPTKMSKKKRVVGKAATA